MLTAGVVQALADAQASVADGCDLDLVGLGAAGDSGIFCAVELATEDNSTVEDATVEVAVDAVAVSGCNGSAQNITAEDGEVRGCDMRCVLRAQRGRAVLLAIVRCGAMRHGVCCGGSRVEPSAAG